MRSPHPPTDATRFFARPLSGVLECPRCGTVLTFATGSGPRQRTKGWNPRTSSLSCWCCHLVTVLGLIMWPVKPGSSGRTAPRDQVPDERQLVQMRNMGEGAGAGWWMPKQYAKPAKRCDDTNLTAVCTCPELSDGTPDVAHGPADCPIHGEGVPESAGWQTRGDHYPQKED